MHGCNSEVCLLQVLVCGGATNHLKLLQPCLGYAFARQAYAYYEREYGTTFGQADAYVQGSLTIFDHLSRGRITNVGYAAMLLKWHTQLRL
jgi:hypothetical protein